MNATLRMTAGQASPLRSSDAEVLVDLLAILAISVAICFGAQHLALMSALVPAVMLLRTVLWSRVLWSHVLWSRVLKASWRDMVVELAFLILCALIGGFNDWNSVVRHHIYAYDVPTYYPQLSTIPFWMLLYWGMILRFLLTLATWHRMGEVSANETRFGRKILSRRPAVRVGVMLLLVLLTRQCIYLTYADPVTSWLPFALAGLGYVFFFGLRKADVRICAFMLIAGPAIESLYIAVAGLHHYALGWFGGVPLWIALWWMLGVLVWRDIGVRLLLTLRRGLGAHMRIRATSPTSPRSPRRST